jgi:hypothetical protein
MRRYLHIYVALTVFIPPVFGQDTLNEEPKAQSTVTVQTPNPDGSAAPARQKRGTAPQAYSYRPTQKKSPAAQYSPLTAQGGYWREQKSPWQMIVDYFNPRHLNLGQIWEQRCRAWLDNVATNEYFWYAYCVTGLLIVSWIVLWWVHDDKLRALAELAENTADALRYSEYCKRQAKQAIRRYNDRVEKCNRIIEDNRSSLMTTPETAELDSCKRELQELRNDNGSLKLQNASLKHQLEAKHSEFQVLNERIPGVEQRIQSDRGAGPKSTNAELVERIRRLEEEKPSAAEEGKQSRRCTIRAGRKWPMLIGVVGFGSIWSSRGASGSRPAAYFNTTGVNSTGRYRHRSCVHGYVRIDECTGFRLHAADRAINRTYESDPLSVWQGRRKLFLRGFVKADATPDVYLVRLSPLEVGWIDLRTKWLCNSRSILSFSEGNDQQEVLVILPPYGWTNTSHGTFFCCQNGNARPWLDFDVTGGFDAIPERKY